MASYQDEYDDFGPPQPAQNLPIDDLGSSAQPVNVVGLLEGKQAFQTPADVHRDMVNDMRDILHIPKNIHYAGTAVYKTANRREMDKLVDACFSLNHQDWSTGQDHPVPALKDITPSVENVAVAFALFSAPVNAVSRVKGYNNPGRKEIIHKQVNRNLSTLKVTKPIEPQQPSSYRQQNSRIVLALERTTENGIKWQYYDGAHRKLPITFRPDPSTFLPVFRTLADVKLAAMKKYELYMMNKGREYNIKLAIAIARNRLTFYANGGPITQCPPGEEEMKSMFVRYKLVRNMVVPEDCVVLKAQVAAIPLPDLFHNIEF